MGLENSEDPKTFPAHIQDVKPNAGVGTLDLPPSSNPECRARRDFRSALRFIIEESQGMSKGRTIDGKLAAEEEVEKMLSVSQIEERCVCRDAV